MTLPITKDAVIRDAVGSVVQKRYALGEIPAANAKPPVEGWGLEYFQTLVNSLPRSPGAAMPGAKDHSEGWLKPLKEFLTEEEGVRTRSYDDTKGNRTVGIGFNLDRPGGREDFKKALGADDKFFDAVYQGTAQLTRAQVEALLDYDLPNLHSQLMRDTGGRSLSDNQTVALMSLAFNFGYQGAKKQGILDLVLQGRLNEAVQRTASLPGGKSRRIKEAKILGGLDAQLAFK